jgi:2-haloacid dehalogenase
MNHGVRRANQLSYQIILFDADDTLFDYSKSESFALTEAFKHIGIDCSASIFQSYRFINQQLWNDYEKGIIKLELLRSERFKRLFAEHDLISEFNVDDFSDNYIKYLGEGSFLIEGAVDICNYLLSNGFRIAVITNGIKEVQLGRINKSELSTSFEHIIVSEDAGFQKPHTGIFEYAFNKLDIQDKSRVLIVGDSLSSDIQGGMNYGIDTCWFNPNRKINSSGIKPTFEINKLEELLRLFSKGKNVVANNDERIFKD